MIDELIILIGSIDLYLYFFSIFCNTDFYIIVYYYHLNIKVKSDDKVKQNLLVLKNEDLIV